VPVFARLYGPLGLGLGLVFATGAGRSAILATAGLLVQTLAQREAINASQIDWILLK